MKGAFRPSMAWLHTWTGLLFGWLLFAIFLTGTSAYFQSEITRWMKPEVASVRDPASATQAAFDRMMRIAPDADSWFITPPSARNPGTEVYWQMPEKADAPHRGHRADTSATLDGDGRPVASRETQGGFFLYRFHFDLHYMPVIWARYLVGVAAMSMLIAILSGVVTHKKIFVDFFMLRFGKGQRSWLDAHNVTAVFALPFYLMITYTGLVTLASQYMPWGVVANYRDISTFYDAVYPRDEGGARSGKAAPLAAIAPLMADASRRWGGAGIGYVAVVNPGDRNARITLTPAPDAAIGARGGSIAYDGVTGRPVRPAIAMGGAVATQQVMVGLHAGRYAGWGLRWLYFLSGVGGTIMVGTGLILWTSKRRTRLPDPARPHFGFRLVERLNIAAIVGLPIGIAVYFLANRLLPIGMAERPEREIGALFAAWGAVLVWACARPARRAWIEMPGTAAVLFAAVPLVNAATTPRNLLTGLMTGDWLFVGFDAVMLAMAALFAMAARKAARAAVQPVRRPRRAARPAPAQAAASANAETVTA